METTEDSVYNKRDERLHRVMNETLDKESRMALVKYRVEKSDISMEEADLLAEKGYYDSAVTRLYYACFYIAGALLIKDEIEAGSHAGVKRMLSLKYVYTGKLDKNLIKIYSDLLNGRQLSDYEDFIYQDEASYRLYRDEAKKFCGEIKKLLSI